MSDLLRCCYELATAMAEWAAQHHCHALQAELTTVASSIAGARNKGIGGAALAEVADALADLRGDLATMTDSDVRATSAKVLLKIVWRTMQAAAVSRVETPCEWTDEGLALPGKDVAATVSAWWRQEALRHHPDRGGDTKVMAALLDAYERLRAALGL